MERLNFDCDVLVVGGGIGGARAALRAKELGSKVILVEKAVIARAGPMTYVHSQFAPYKRVEGEEMTDWINANAAEAKKLLNAEIQAETTKGIAPEVLERAWGRIEITSDPVSSSLKRCAKDAHAAGFLEKDPDLSKIYALDLLNQVLAAKGRPGVL